VRPTYRSLLDDIADGRLIESRYGSTLELINVGVDFRPGEMVSRRGFNRKLAFMELLQVLAGVYNFEAIEKVAPKAALGLFSEKGAYGPRLATQLQVIVKTLTLNSGTRQAVGFVGRPADSCTNDLPCTMSIQFLVRGGLYTLVSMRSWDLIKGLPYDTVVFGGLCLALGRVLGVAPIRTHVTAGSGHIYLDDSPIIEGLRPSTDLFSFTQEVPRTWEGIRAWAHDEVHRVFDPGDKPWPAGIRLIGEEPEDA
jgi:hypothetical protein